MPRLFYGLVYLLTFLSGFSSLVYEVVWHRYLGILLGAQARATALILAIFLGGMSLGYFVFGRLTKRFPQWNLVAYVVIEVVLGLWAIFFPTLFHAVFSASAGWVSSQHLMLDALLGVLLIGVPTFLMGATLPILTQGFSSNLEVSSRVHAKIYGFNTLGAAVGSFVAGYILIPLTSLPWALKLGGGIHLGAAFFFLVIILPRMKRISVSEKTSKRKGVVTSSPATAATVYPLLITAALSGFYLITLQTALVRLVGISSGSSHYNFTLIVSIFILSLGLGSLWARKIGQYSLGRLLWNQIAVSAGLLVIYETGHYWFYVSHVIRVLLRDLSQGFYLFQGLLAFGFTSILLVPLGVCGVTLPLCFHLLKDDQKTLGLRVGQIYAVNTIGCVSGAVLGGYALYFWLDIDSILKVCVGSALFSAFVLLVSTRKIEKLWSSRLAAAAIVVLLMGTLLAPSYDKRSFIQPFRQANVIDATFKGRQAFAEYLGGFSDLIFYKDGPNTSLAVTKNGSNEGEYSRSIFVNGKSDGNTRGDYFTTVMLAHLPALFVKEPSRACIIGFGTGITIGSLAAHPHVKNIEVVEIADTILKQKHLFDKYNREVSKNPKVRFNEMDAVRYLASVPEGFDVVISEPSNPWVVGVENLYSLEFYELAKKRLNSGGMFVQWIHTYAFSDKLLKRVLRTVGSVFPEVRVFQLKGGDLALVATAEPISKDSLRIAKDRFDADKTSQMLLQIAGVRVFESILALEILPPAAVRSVAARSDLHRLESPRLSTEAAKMFFSRDEATPYELRRKYPEYFESINDSLMAHYLNGKALQPQVANELVSIFCDDNYAKNKHLCEEALALMTWTAEAIRVPTSEDLIVPSEKHLKILRSWRKVEKGGFRPEELEHELDSLEVYKKYRSPLAYFPESLVSARVDECLRAVSLKEDLHGECLLQKVLLYQMVRADADELVKLSMAFGHWLKDLPPKSPHFQKFSEALKLVANYIGVEPEQLME